jgi:hypothetical protein
MSIRNEKYVSFLTAPEHVVDTILRKVEHYNVTGRRGKRSKQLLGTIRKLEGTGN